MVTGASKKITRNQKPYVIFTVSDKTTTKDIKVWGIDGDKYPELMSAKWLKITCNVGEYDGQIDLTSNEMPMIVPAPQSLDPYMNDRGLDDDKASGILTELIHVIQNNVDSPFIRGYLEYAYTTLDRNLLLNAPASSSNRGAYRGGLLEHIYKVLKNAISIASNLTIGKSCPKINMDIVIAGVLMHDLGKIYTYGIDDAGLAYAKSSNTLIGHLSLSYSISVMTWIALESNIGRAVPEEIKDHINHCILAHHGQLAYGSPVKPHSLEAYIVHVADMADSMSSNFAEASLAGQPNEFGFVDGSKFSSIPLFVGGQQ